tara:strand:+ start:178 stop:660 length:483 start_codon:yes stop_codon:yes gene_type:complete
MPEVQIVDYEVRFASHFASLNYQWITEYFRVEEEDRKALDDPEGYAIRPGGNIFFLLEDKIPVGTVAMVPITRSEEEQELCFELAKMAVRPDCRGKGYGSMLMQYCIDFARSAEAHEIMLVTNDVLSAAVALYEQAGFREVSEYSDSRYERGNLEMRLTL